jgi:hypothetical protein
MPICRESGIPSQYFETVTGASSPVSADPSQSVAPVLGLEDILAQLAGIFRADVPDQLQPVPGSFPRFRS